MHDDDINGNTILGFKYTENQDAITLSPPPKGIRKVAFLQCVGDSFRWFWIPEPQHDSNKLYASFRGLPIGTTANISLEDLGLHIEGFNEAEEKGGKVHLLDFVGAGWMKTLDDAFGSPFLVAYCLGGNQGQEWHVTKMKAWFAASFSKSQKCDIAIPLIQPKRVVSKDGVYFVG